MEKLFLGPKTFISGKPLFLVPKTLISEENVVSGPKTIFLEQTVVSDNMMVYLHIPPYEISCMKYQLIYETYFFCSNKNILLEPEGIKYPDSGLGQA